MAARAKSEIKLVVLEVIEACNHACVHCYNYWRPRTTGDSDIARQASPLARGPVLSRSEILSLLKRVRRDTSVSWVAVSGGEPFVRKETPEIVSDLTREGFGVVIITNGTLITEDRLRRLPDSASFEITLFSVYKERHDQIAGRESFQRLLRTFALLHKHKRHLVLGFVLSKLNAVDITRTIEMGVAVGAGAIMLNRVNLSRNVMPIASELVPPLPMLREALTAADDTAAKYGIPVVLSVPIPPCLADPKDYPHLQFGWCPRGGKEAYYTIGCTGLVRPCNHSSLVLGDLRRERFGAIIASDQNRKFWAAAPVECQLCTHPLKDNCAGGCRAAAAECYGNPARIDPYVDFTFAASRA